MLTLETIRRAREALLPDHLDLDGLGPSTVVELAPDSGPGGLPTATPPSWQPGSTVAPTGCRLSSTWNRSPTQFTPGSSRNPAIPRCPPLHARRCHWEWQDRRVRARDGRRTATSAVVSLVHAVAMATVSGSPDPPTADRALRLRPSPAQSGG